jgi:hypothetical protein
MKKIKLLFVLGFLFKPKQWINVQCDSGQISDTIFSGYVLKAKRINLLLESFVKKSNFKGSKIYGSPASVTLSFKQRSFDSHQTLFSTTNSFDKFLTKIKIAPLLIS